MKRWIRTAALCTAALGLAGAAAAQEAKPKAAGPVPVPYPNRSDAVMAKPALTGEAAALRAKLAQAQADLVALAKQPAPAGLSPRDAAALQAQQAADSRLAQQLAALMAELDGGASAGDVGQQLQFELQVATSTYQQAAQAKSNALKKHHDAVQAIISKLK